MHFLQLESTLEARNLRLEQYCKTVWTGDLTLNVTLKILDAADNVLLSDSYHHNRSPSTFKAYGLYANRGGARHKILTAFEEALLSDPPAAVPAAGSTAVPTAAQLQKHNKELSS